MLSIEFTNSPLGVYYPGSVLEGVVKLELKEPLKIRDIKLCIDGHAKNHWDRTESRTVSGTKSESYTINYSAKIQYADGHSTIWTNKGSNLPVGKHTFPFKFQIPINCPPSFEVAPAFDLNTIPRCAIPMKQEVCEKTGFVLRRRGNITLETRLQKSGFVPGEIIYIECLVNNESSKKVFRTSAELIQCAEFIAYESGCGSATFHNHRYVGIHEKKSSASTISCLSQSIDIPPKSKGSFAIKLPVRPTVPSFNCCPITKVDYYLKVKIESETSVSNTIKTRLPIILGTIPVRSQALTLAPLVMPAKGDGFSSSATTNPTAPPEYPQPIPQPVNLPNLPPPSYEQAVYGDAKPKSDELDGFLPRYPVYPNLDSYLGTSNATKEEDLPSVSTIKL